MVEAQQVTSITFRQRFRAAVAAWKGCSAAPKPQAHEHPDEQEEPAFARGIAGPLGKLTEELKTKVDETTFDLFRRHCTRNDLDAAVVLRDCVYAVIYGKTYRQMVAEKLSHEVQITDAITKLTGSFGAPESEARVR